MKSPGKILVEYLTNHPAASGAMMTKAMRGHVTPNGMHKFLQNLQAEGLIHRIGNTSGAKWYAGPDPVKNRNEAIMRLSSISYDIRKVAALLNDVSEFRASQLRQTAETIEDITLAVECER